MACWHAEHVIRMHLYLNVVKSCLTSRVKYLNHSICDSTKKNLREKYFLAKWLFVPLNI